MRNIKDTIMDENGLSGFRYVGYGDWVTSTDTGLCLCFKNDNPLRRSYNLVEWDLYWEMNRRLEKPVFEKTNFKTKSTSF